MGAKKNAVWSVCWSLHCFELPASPWFSMANSDRIGNPICSDVIQIQIDSYSISWLTGMTSLICCIRIVVSPPCGSSSFPAYRGLALICFPVFYLWSAFSPHIHWLMLPLRLGFPTKPQRQCLHFTRVCGLGHHPSLSNSVNVSSHHLADSAVASRDTETTEMTQPAGWIFQIFEIFLDTHRFF